MKFLWELFFIFLKKLTNLSIWLYVSGNLVTIDFNLSTWSVFSKAVELRSNYYFVKVDARVDEWSKYLTVDEFSKPLDEWCYHAPSVDDILALATRLLDKFFIFFKFFLLLLDRWKYSLSSFFFFFLYATKHSKMLLILNQNDYGDTTRAFANNMTLTWVRRWTQQSMTWRLLCLVCKSESMEKMQAKLMMMMKMRLTKIINTLVGKKLWKFIATYH